MCSQGASCVGNCMRTLNLHQLATFQSVARHRSYVRAAKELHFSQPAVSAQMRQLEESLGKFRQLFPEVEITLDVLNRATLVDALVENRVDMAVMGTVPAEIPMVIEPFAPNELVLIAAPTHRLAGLKEIPFAELAREHFLLREIGS